MNEAALITGAAQRVGKALALHLARSGYDIALHYHASEAAAHAVQAEITGMGRKCKLYRADLGDLPALPALAHDVIADFPACHALVNNASVFTRGTFLDSDPALCARMLRINYEAPAFLAQAFASRQGKGHIINMLDTHIETNGNSHFFYLQSKKALRDFTQMAAVGLGPAFRVNAVCPGVVLPSGEEADYIERLEARLPLRSTAKVESVCRTVEWLLRSEDITGQLIYVDGGEHLL